ncbi:MAG: GNAT family N-acetyltransferase, partial [Lachnospiraceae bacterium]|nr:GNAT family N-acetyltransferase [Candidatus Minthocola equi]
TLYKSDPNYVPYMRRDYKRTIKKLILNDKSYTGLLAMDESGQVLARILFTIDKNKQLHTEKCGFFCMYECVDDKNVSHALLARMKELLTEDGAEYISGTYFPHDPDNRRGIMVKGFERAPLILTSYNKPYYASQFEEFGFVKQTDAVEYTLIRDEDRVSRLHKLAKYVNRHCDIRIDKVDLKHPDDDIHDVHTIMSAAENEIIYQEAPSETQLHNILSGWKNFLEPDYIMIARRNSDDAPIGFLMAIPDYFELFRLARGRMDIRGLFILLFGRKRIKSIRGILQYVIPEYQNKGIIASLIAELCNMVDKHGIDYIEAGTMMENNSAARSVIESSGGELSRIYRIYYMSLK